MTRSISRLWSYLALRRKKQLGLLLLLTTVASFAEVLSIGSVLPFLGALTAPEQLFQHSLSQPFIRALGLTKPEELLLPLTLIFITAAIFSAAIRVFLLWQQTRVGHEIGADFSIEIYQRTLYQPYYVHILNNSSKVIAGVSVKVNDVVSQAILPLLTITSATLMLTVITAALIALDPWIAISVFVGFGAIYFPVTLVTKRKLAENGKKISKNSNQVIKALQEGLGGIRDVLIDGTQNTYCEIYRSADISLRRAKASNQIMAGTPRFLIEGLGMSLIAFLAYRITANAPGFSNAIPILGALALGAQRLLPVMQQVYQSWSSLEGGRAYLDDVLDLISQPLSDDFEKTPSEPIRFEESIRLNDISFCYATHSSPVLSHINLEIRKGSRVGFVGTTGSGKSTLLDVVMGLLLPTSGRLEIDGVPITAENYRAWQVRIAHVPQSIFLADISIAENIAFGIPQEKIDLERVKSAARKARIADVIESWRDQYQTPVGERGVRLSGGQRQRIGIARALYKEANVLILDEATSALDDETEASVMEELNASDDEMTILMVAHRRSTLTKCDQVYKISSGKIFSSEEIN